MTSRRKRRGVWGATLVVTLVMLSICSSIAAAVSATSNTAGAATPSATVVKPRPHVNKARPFSASSPWNTPTSKKVSWFDTKVLHSLSDGSFRHWWVNTGSVGIWWAKPTDPIWTFKLPNYIAPAWHRNRHARTLRMRAPWNIKAATDADHILVVIDQNSGNYVELWGASVDRKTRTVTNLRDQVGWATGNAITGPGAGSLANNNGVRAANFSWAGGLITGADMKAHKIDHALVIALPWDMLMGGGLTGHRNGSTYGPRVWRAPATAWDAGWWSGPIQMGSRIGIRAGVPKPAGLSPLGTMVFRALQKYGAFVGDFVGGQWPEFVADKRTVTERQVCPLFCYWQHSNGSSDMEKIGPLLRVAGYQP